MNELDTYLIHTPMQWAQLDDGRDVMTFPDMEMAEMVATVLWHLYGLTFTLRDEAPVACLLVPVVH